MLTVYAFRDMKSGVLSNHFISGEPFGKVQQNISVSLLQLSLKDKTNPFVLFAQDYDLVEVMSVPDEIPLSELSVSNHVNCEKLLFASRNAFDASNDQTSPTATSENDLE